MSRPCRQTCPRPRRDASTDQVLRECWRKVHAHVLLSMVLTGFMPMCSIAAGWPAHVLDVVLGGGTADEPIELSTSSSGVPAYTVPAGKDDCGWSKIAALQCGGLVTLFVCLLVLSAEFHSLSQETTTPTPSSSSLCGGVCSRYGMVSSTNLWASRAGAAVLEQGGNAVDAAAAVQFMLNVAQPQSTGIGGGCFILYYHAATGSLYALDGREEAPAAFLPNMFCDDPDCRNNATCPCGSGPINFEDRVTGGNSVGVPGTLAAVDRLLREHGTWPLARVLQPAIDAARQGLPMSQYLHDRIVSNRARLELFQASRDLFLPQAGEPVPPGQLWRNDDLAATLELIAREGTEVFYTGEVARDIVSTVKDAVNPVTGLRGVMEASDLASYRPVYRRPVFTRYRNFTVCGMPLPSSGGPTMRMMLGNLEPFQLPDMTPAATEYFHRVIDAQDVAFADRNHFMGDADWVEVPPGLFNKTYALERVIGLTHSLHSAGAPVPHGDPEVHVPLAQRRATLLATAPDNERHGTTHFSIVDREGNVVSMTTTIEENLGSAVVVPGRGFLLNNELTDFTGTANDPATGLPYANRPEGGKQVRRTALGPDASTSGGKRPMSSMTPTMVFQSFGQQAAGGDDADRIDVPDGALGAIIPKDILPVLALGSPGGSRIIGTVLNVLLAVLDGGLPLDQATDLPRVVSRNDFALAELHTDPAVVSRLQGRGFDVRPYIVSRPLGFVQSVQILRDSAGQTRTLVGKADDSRLDTALAAPAVQ